MKKIFYLLLLFITGISQAQITMVCDETGNAIQDGDIFTVNQDQVTTHVTITNNYTYDVNLQLEVVNIINTDGSEMSLCFGVIGAGQCLPSIASGDIYNGGAPLPAGGHTRPNDVDFTHHEVANQSNFSYPKDYIFKISALNTSNGSEISSITFTYRYDPNGSLEKLDNNEFSISSTHSGLQIFNAFQTTVNIYNLTGEKVMELNLPAGNHEVNTQNLSTGVFIIYARARNKEIYKKIIIK